jgi:hypothetical protein
VTVVYCARPRSITRAASGFTPRSSTQVSSRSVIKLSSTVQEWPNRPVGFPVGLQGVGGANLPRGRSPMANSLPQEAPFQASDWSTRHQQRPAAASGHNGVNCTSTVVPAARALGLTRGGMPIRREDR